MTSAPKQEIRAALARLRARRKGRGAIFVESIIVIAMLTLMMASALFFHGLYARKLKTMRESRAAAWEKSLPGCNSAVELVAVWQAVGLVDSISGLNEDSDTAPEWMSVGRQEDTKSVTVTADKLVGGTYNLKTTNSIVCNEKGDDHRGDIIAVLTQMWDTLIPSG